MDLYIFMEWHSGTRGKVKERWNSHSYPMKNESLHEKQRVISLKNLGLILYIIIFYSNRQVFMIPRRIWLYIDTYTSSFSLAPLVIICDHRFLHIIWDLFFLRELKFQTITIFQKYFLRFSIMKDSVKESSAYLMCDHQLPGLHNKNTHQKLQCFLYLMSDDDWENLFQHVSHRQYQQIIASIYDYDRLISS